MKHTVMCYDANDKFIDLYEIDTNDDELKEKTAIAIQEAKKRNRRFHKNKKIHRICWIKIDGYDSIRLK